MIGDKIIKEKQLIVKIINFGMIIALSTVLKSSDCINYPGEGVFVTGVHPNHCYRTL